MDGVRSSSAAPSPSVEGASWTAPSPSARWLRHAPGGCGMLPVATARAPGDYGVTRRGRAGLHRWPHMDVRWCGGNRAERLLARSFLSSASGRRLAWPAVGSGGLRIRPGRCAMQARRFPLLPFLAALYFAVLVAGCADPVTSPLASEDDEPASEEVLAASQDDRCLVGISDSDLRARVASLLQEV